MKRRSAVLLSALLVLLGSCFDVYGSELMQGGPEGYVFYYGLESMQSDGSNRKKLCPLRRSAVSFLEKIPLSSIAKIKGCMDIATT